MRWLLLIALAACRAKSDVAPCGTVAGQFFQLANRDLGSAGVDDKTRRAVTDQLPAMRDQLAVACTEGKWAAEVRTCMANAQDHAAFQTCEQQLTNDQRKALDHVAVEPPASR